MARRRYYKQRLPPDTSEDKSLGDPNNPEDQLYSYWVEFSVLVPNDYSRLEKQTDKSQGHSVFQGVLKDQPPFQDDTVDPNAASIFQDDDGNDVYGYVLDATDENHKSDHQNEEMIVGRPENGNGGLVSLPKGHGGAPNYPSIWAPGTGALWTKFPPGGTGTEQHDATDWQPSEAERQLMKEVLDDVLRDPTRPPGTGHGPEGAAGPLGQYIDPRTVNRVAKITLTHPPNSGSTDPRYGPDSPPSRHPFPHTLADDTSEYNDLVDELLVCTTDGAYLMRSKTSATNGATRYDPPVLISDVSHDPTKKTDVRDGTAADMDGDGVLDIVLVTGPGAPDVVYLADPTDPLMKKIGVDSDDGGTTTRGGLRKHELGRTYDNPGTDGEQGTPDDVYTTLYKRDSTSVVAIDPDGDNVPDVVIVGTRKALDYVACCGDAGKVHDITAATAGGTLDAYDTETVAAAKFRPPLDPSDVKLADGESVVITVVFGTINRDNEASGMADVYMTIESAQRYGTPIDGLVASTEVLEGPDGVVGTGDDVTITVTAGAFLERDGTTLAVTATSQIFTDELRQNRLPGSKKDDTERHATHTVQFVEIPNSLFDLDGTTPATAGVRNHLYVGFHNQQVNLGTDTDGINQRVVLGNYYPAPTDVEMRSSTVGGTNEYKYDPTAPDSKLQYIYDPNGIHAKLALQMRGMDVVIPDPASAEWRDTVPSVHMLTNGGTVLEIRPGLVTSTVGMTKMLLYDAADGSSQKPSEDMGVNGPDSIKLGLLRTDGTTEDLTDVTSADAVAIRDADYTGGLVVVADFDGDTYPDVLSGRHISYNTAAAGTQGHSGAHPGQRGIYDGLPKEWWTFGVTPSAVEAFDADGDGDLDLIVVPRGYNADTDVVPSDALSTANPLVQILLNDGSGVFSRAERRAMLMASFDDAGDSLPLAVKITEALKITTGHLNPDEDAREDLVLLIGSDPSAGGSPTAYVSDSSGGSDADRAHVFEFVNLRTTAQASANKIRDVLVTSLTGVAATDAARRPLQDVVMLEDTGSILLVPGTAFAGTAAAMTDAASYFAKETAIQGTTVTVAGAPNTMRKLDVGYVLRNGPSGGSSGFLRNDAVGGSELPLRKSGGDSDATPTDLDADTGDTLQVAIVGQTDNTGAIRDALEPELRTPDIVLAGTTEVWMISPGSLIRDVSTRYASATPKKLHTYASGSNAERTPTSIQVRDSVSALQTSNTRRPHLTRACSRAGPQRPRRHPPQLQKGRRQHQRDLPRGHLRVHQLWRHRGACPQTARRLRHRPARRWLQQVPRPQGGRRPAVRGEDALKGRQRDARQRRRHDQDGRRGRRSRRLLRHCLCGGVQRRRARQPRAQGARERRALGHVDGGQDDDGHVPNAQRKAARHQCRDRRHAQADGQLARLAAEQLRHDADGAGRHRGHHRRPGALHRRRSHGNREPWLRRDARLRRAAAADRARPQRTELRHLPRGRHHRPRRVRPLCDRHRGDYRQLHAAQPRKRHCEANVPGAKGEGGAHQTPLPD